MAFWIPIKYVSSWVKFKAVEFNLFLKKFSACRLLVFNSEIHGSSPLLHPWHPALTQSAPCTPEGWRAPGRMTTLWDKHQQWKNLKRLFYLPDTISQAIAQICLCVQLVKNKVSSPMCKRADKQRTQTRILSYGKPHWAPEWGLSKQPLFNKRVKMLQMLPCDKQSSHYFWETSTPQHPLFRRLIRWMQQNNAAEACQAEGESCYSQKSSHKDTETTVTRLNWQRCAQCSTESLKRSDGALVKHDSTVSMNVTGQMDRFIYSCWPTSYLLPSPSILLQLGSM